MDQDLLRRDQAGPTKQSSRNSTSPYPYTSRYNAQGQQWKQVDPDGVTTLYQYNLKGELAYTAFDTNRNDVIDFAGNDRITWATNYVTTNNGTTVRRTQNYIWPLAARMLPIWFPPREFSRRVADLSILWNAGTGVTNQSQTVYAVVATVT